MRTSQTWRSSLQHRQKTQRSTKTWSKVQSGWSLLKGEKQADIRFIVTVTRSNSPKFHVILLWCSWTRSWTHLMEAESSTTVKYDSGERGCRGWCGRFHVQFSAAAAGRSEQHRQSVTACSRSFEKNVLMAAWTESCRRVKHDWLFRSVECQVVFVSQLIYNLLNVLSELMQAYFFLCRVRYITDIQD